MRTVLSQCVLEQNMQEGFIVRATATADQSVETAGSMQHLATSAMTDILSAGHAAHP